MSNTQARMLDLNAAIERDRAARKAEESQPEISLVESQEPQHDNPWELWVAIGVGLMVILIATIL